MDSLTLIVVVLFEGGVTFEMTAAYADAFKCLAAENAVYSAFVDSEHVVEVFTRCIP